MKCAQCPNVALHLYGDKLALCLDCSMKFQELNRRQMAELAHYANYLTGQMEAIAGIGPVLPRYPVPQPTVLVGPTTFNNIRVDRSTIGAINTGTIHELDVALGQAKTSGQAEVVEALRRLTEAVLAARDIDARFKSEALEHLAFLASQAATPPEKRKAAVGSAVVEGLERSIASASGIAAIWDAVKGPILGLFSPN